MQQQLVVDAKWKIMLKLQVHFRMGGRKDLDWLLRQERFQALKA